MSTRQPGDGPVFTFSGINFSIKEKQILQGVSGSVASGQMMAGTSSSASFDPPHNRNLISDGSFGCGKEHTP